MENTKLDLILRYKYVMVLSPSNSKVELKEFKDDISTVKEIFNRNSKDSANIKKITSCVVDETNNYLLITLVSMNKLPVAIRGIRMFTQKLMEILEEKRGKEYVENMIKRKSIFRMISVEEFKNLKFDKSEEKEDTEEITILTNKEKMKEKNIDLSEVTEILQKLTALFLKVNTSKEEMEKIKKIKEILMGN